MKIRLKEWIEAKDKQLREMCAKLPIDEPDDFDELAKQIANSAELVMSVESIRNAVEAVVSRTEEMFHIWWSSLSHDARSKLEEGLPRSRQVSEKQVECCLLSDPVISQKYLKKKNLLRMLYKLRADWRALSDAMSRRDYALGNLCRMGLKGVPVTYPTNHLGSDD